MHDAAAPFIAGPAGPPYVWRCMPRLLCSLLLALALLISPLAMIGGAGPAHAAMPQAGAEAAHCADEGPAPQHEKRGPGMDMGCAIACAAMPATAPSTTDPLPRGGMTPESHGDQYFSGIQLEGETPPPRSHPEI